MSGRSNKVISITHIVLVIFLIHISLHSNFQGRNDALTMNAALLKVLAGKTSPLELSRIKIYLLRCKTDLRSAVSKFHSTGVSLASLWGEDSFSYRSVIAGYSEWENFTISEEMNKISQLNPDLALLKKVIKQHEVELRLEKAVRIPDISISGGIKRHSETGLTAFTAGISIPVPWYCKKNI